MRKILVVMALAAVLGACGSDDGSGVNASGSASASAAASGGASGSAAASGSGTAENCKVEDGVTGEAGDEVHAELTEFKIALDKTTAKAGKVKFEAENAGKDEHEIVIVKAADASKLPIDKDGGADEAQFEDDLIGEIEPFAPESECDGTFELAAGTYAVFCNIVEEEDNGEMEAHYKEGMFTTLTVS